MPIDFEIPEEIKNQSNLTQMVAEQVMRKYSRYYDEREHERPWEYINFIWPFMKSMEAANLKRSLRQSHNGHNGHGKNGGNG
ncbi:MAG TPA: acyl-CoA dehydrogenase, partial [Anaerolineae bacterium]|nr:acyl-CoA dehydrogenase [Anaerolineae bacterium]